MWQDITPPITGEGDMGGGECGNYVVFSCAYVPLCGKGAVVIGGGKLKVEVLGSEEVGKGSGGFIV